MTSKLTSSLRKSISAEKQSVEDKQTLSTNDNAVVATKTAAEKPIAKSTTPRKTSLRKATTKKDLNNEIKPVVEDIKISANSEQPLKNNIKNDKDGNSSTSAQASIDSIKIILDKINSSSLELSNSFIENFMGVNQDFNDYLQQVSDVSNLAKIKEVNEKFLDNLRKRQQELIKKNMELFGAFKLV